jgi:hypothetical protein
VLRFARACLTEAKAATTITPTNNNKNEAKINGNPIAAKIEILDKLSNNENSRNEKELPVFSAAAISASPLKTSSGIPYKWPLIDRQNSRALFDDLFKYLKLLRLKASSSNNLRVGFLLLFKRMKELSEREEWESEGNAGRARDNLYVLEMRLHEMVYFYIYLYD